VDTLEDIIRLRPNNISIRDSLTTIPGRKKNFITLITDSYSARDSEISLSCLEYTEILNNYKISINNSITIFEYRSI
jgi:hypothetical protein